MTDDLIFIMLRYIENDYHNYHWIESYKSIRKFYNNCKIYIIDSNSKKSYIENNEILENCEIINSCIPNSRLYTPFYYLIKNLISNYDTAVIIHDSLIINNYINFMDINKVKYLWHFETHLYDNKSLELRQIEHLNNNKELIKLYNELNWHGCLGCMLVIKKNFINEIENKFNLSNLVNIINNKDEAISFERVISILCYYLYPQIKNDISYCGDIKNMIWGYSYRQYIKDRDNNNLITDPLIKLFLGR